MPQRRLNVIHVAAEDRLRPSGQSGSAVAGYATFYFRGTGWNKILPGELDLAELWGGSSGFGNNEALISAKRVPQPGVEFYFVGTTSLHPQRRASYVAMNGAIADYFTFGFFGKRFS